MLNPFIVAWQELCSIKPLNEPMLSSRQWGSVAFFRELRDLKLLSCMMSLKIIHLKLLPYLTEANELNSLIYDFLIIDAVHNGAEFDCYF